MSIRTIFVKTHGHPSLCKVVQCEPDDPDRIPARMVKQHPDPKVRWTWVHDNDESQPLTEGMLVGSESRVLVTQGVGPYHGDGYLHLNRKGPGGGSTEIAVMAQVD